MFTYGTLQHKVVPAPQILLRAYSPGNEVVSGEDTEAIVDTGAVMTCVPKRVIEELGETSLNYSYLTVSGAVGSRKLKTYIIHLRIAECDFQYMEVIAFDREYALIGRDILNKYKITFDGLKGIWEVDAKCA